MYCQSCGATNPEGSQQCLGCQQPLPPAEPTSAWCQAHPTQAAVGACSRCGTFFCANCLAPVGSDWLCEGCRAKTSVLPWDERERLGLFRAWWRTSLAMITRPVETLKAAQPDAPLGSSLLFAVLSMLAGLGPTLLLYAVALVPLLSLGKQQTELPFPAALVPVGALAYLVLALLFQVVMTLGWAAVEHVCLMLVGGAPKSYGTSVRAHALALGPYALGLIPLCGLYVFPIWSLVLGVLGVQHLHRVSGGRAAAAVLVPVALFCGACGAFYAAMFALGMGSALR